MKAACDDCVFFDLGKCRRFPPTLRPLAGSLMSRWVIVSGTDWCGEFQHANPPEPEPWKCGRCDRENEDGRASVCDWCGTARGHGA